MILDYIWWKSKQDIKNLYRNEVKKQLKDILINNDNMQLQLQNITEILKMKIHSYCYTDLKEEPEECAVQLNQLLLKFI